MRVNCGETPEKDKVAKVLWLSVMMTDGTVSRRLFVKRAASKRGNRPQRVEFTPRGRVSIMDELEAASHAVKVGLGLSIIAADSVLDALSDGSLVRVLPDYDVCVENAPRPEVIIQYPARRNLPSRIRVLVDLLIEKLHG